ncbi:MAG: hypothetical protein ABIS86_19185 [Streptosporangiaceae bacterium]
MSTTFRTLNGATITLTGSGIDCAATCDGCGDGIGRHARLDLPPVRDWAQAHAAACWALPSTALPEGVLQRAVTVGGGHIDIRQGHPLGTEHTASGRCSGCGAVDSSAGTSPGIAVARVMRWARVHATCPFVPAGVTSGAPE